MRLITWAAWLTTGLLVVGLVFGGTVAATWADEAGNAEVFQADEPTPANETTRHEDPREVDGDGDLHALRDWLAGRMAVRLEDCVVGVGEGSVDVCDFEDEYPDWLRKYVDVADDTDDEDDDELGEDFDDAAEEADDYAESVREFRQTYREYQEARDAGDEERARELARTLQREGRAVESSGGALVGTFDRIESGGNVDLADGRQSVNATRENVSAIVRTVEREQFVATSLTAELAPRTVSFLEPGELSGRLTAEDGTPVAEEPITLIVGDRILETRTDANGAFTVAYRPTTINRSSTSLRVGYQPRNTSQYLASETTVPVSVEPVTPTVEVSVEPRTARFNTLVTVTGRVAADGIGAPGVPVVVTLDDRELGRVQTDGTGAFSLTATVEAVDGPGEVELRARHPLEGRALEPAHGTARVDIGQTETVLTAEGTAAGASTVDLSGTLQTDASVTVPDQRIEVRINGTPVDTLRTGEEGRFAGTVAVPSSLLKTERQTVRVMAVFAAEGTNLGSSHATLIVPLPPAEGGPGDGAPAGNALTRPVGQLPGDPPRWMVAAVIALIALLGLGIVGWRWRSGGGGDTSPAAETSARPDSTTQPPEPDRPADPLAHARDRLSSDPNGAVMVSYAAVRTDLARAVGAGSLDADTHWEFLGACREDGLDEAAVEALTRLTEVYERAAYAPDAVTTADADAALETAEGLIG